MQFKKKLSQLRRRVTIQWLLDGLSKTIFIAAAAAAGVLTVSFMLPIDYALLWALLIFLAVLLLSLLVLFIIRPKKREMAKRIDEYGFQERLQTMWALKDDSSDMARLQREETEMAVTARDPKEAIPLRFPKKLGWLAVLGMAVCIGIYFLPNPQTPVLEEREQIRVTLKEQAEKVEKLKEDMDAKNRLTSEEKAELNERLDELAKELRKGNDYKEGIKQLSELQKKVDKIKKNTAERQAAEAKKAMEKSKNKKLRKAAEGMEEKSPQSMEEALKRLMDEADKAEREELAKELERLAEELAENEEGEDSEAVKELLEEIAEAIREGDQEALENALESSVEGSSDSTGLAELGSGLKLSQKEISKLSKGKEFKGDPGDLDNDSSGDSGKEGNSDGENDGDKPGGKKPGGKTPGDGGDGGNMPGDGSGDGSGTVSGSGNGNGNGMGSGSGNGPGGGAGKGTGDFVEAEKIYDPSRIEGGENKETLTGEINEDGERTQTETDQGEGTIDGYIPYKDAAGAYRDEAVNAGKRQQLSPAEQAWVEEYFASLLD